MTPIRKAIEATLKWFTENPDKWIKGSLAERPITPGSKHKMATRPSDPEADCFCFLGRFAIENETPDLSLCPLDLLVADECTNPDKSIYTTNDLSRSAKDMVSRMRRRLK